MVVGVGGEGLGRFGWDCSVSLDKRCHNTTSSLNTQRQRGDIEQQEVLNLLTGVTSQDGSLSNSNNQIN